MEINVINRKEEILDPNMPIVEKIGTMAKLCYKVENGNDEGVNERIIKKCIASGHESILEHGIISVFFNPEITDKTKKFCELVGLKQAVSIDTIWKVAPTDAVNKFIEPFMDPELYDKFNVAMNKNTDDKKILPCSVGDVRAWRQVVRERVFFSSKQGDAIQFILSLKLINELSKISKNNILFGDIAQHVNDLLAEKKVRDRMLPKNFKLEAKKGVEEGKQYTIESVSDYFFQEQNMLFAGQAASCASLSVIVTTDRATTHQLVRHRKNVAYSQESQRYVNYKNKGYRVIGMTIDPNKCPEGITVDHDTGFVDDKCSVYDTWMKSITSAFENYESLINVNVPSESARGLLPNDTATKIGITWMRSASYINFNFWRLEKHAQFPIRMMANQILLKMLEMNHPYGETIPHDAVKNWLNNMLEDKAFSDTERIKKVIDHREAVHKSIIEFIKKMSEKKAENKTEPSK